MSVEEYIICKTSFPPTTGISRESVFIAANPLCINSFHKDEENKIWLWLYGYLGWSGLTWSVLSWPPSLPDACSDIVHVNFLTRFLHVYFVFVVKRFFLFLSLETTHMRINHAWPDVHCWSRCWCVCTAIFNPYKNSTQVYPLQSYSLICRAIASSPCLML